VKRFVVFMMVWAMALVGVLGSVFLPGSASAQAVNAPAAGVVQGLFSPLPTARVFDGTATTAPRLVQIAGLGGVPAGAAAVLVNTEVSDPTAAGYVRVTPPGQNPAVATQEFAKGQAVSNLVAVELVAGKVQVKVSAGSARIMMDVSGYFGAKAGSSFTPLPAARVFDGAATTTPRLVQIAGRGGVPATATAVMVNTEVSGPTAAGYVRVTPAGQNPAVATQEFAKGRAISNLVAVKLVGGKIQVKVSAGSARIMIDVSGYYSAAKTATHFTPLPMARVFDATTTTNPRLVRVAGLAGVPVNATAVMVNTGVSGPTAAGYVRVTPAGQNPGVATQEFAKGQAVSNLVAVQLVGGKIEVKVSAGSARIMIDISGYYSAATRGVTPPGVSAPGPVTGLSAIGISDTSIALAWTNPKDASFTGVTIRRSTGATAPAKVTDGTAVTAPASATTTGYADTGLSAGTRYSYGVFAHNGVPSYAAAATVTAWTTGRTAAVLSVISSELRTTSISVGSAFIFDASGSHAGPAGVTIKTVSLDNGDGTAPVSFTGNQDPAYWWEAHSYSAAGTYPVTLTVTDSANFTASQVVTVTITAAPTAAITIQGDPAAGHVGAPVTFTLTPSTPLGTTITRWTVYGDWLAGGYGTFPPATITHTFTEPGTYTVHFDFSNSVQGLAQSSVQVTVLP
jgi:hypothetical protein